MYTVKQFFVVFGKHCATAVHEKQADAMADATAKAKLYPRNPVYILTPYAGYIVNDPRPEQILIIRDKLPDEAKASANPAWPGEQTEGEDDADTEEVLDGEGCGRRADNLQTPLQRGGREGSKETGDLAARADIRRP